MIEMEKSTPDVTAKLISHQDPVVSKKKRNTVYSSSLEFFVQIFRGLLLKPQIA